MHRAALCGLAEFLRLKRLMRDWVPATLGHRPPQKLWE
jgi:hypothetical protein